MKRTILQVLLLAMALTLAQSQQVVDLDDSNFTSYLAEHPYVFVEFYAPWCGHCKALAPQYEKLAKLAEGKNYIIAKVDATVATNTSKQYQVEGYPTIKFLANGFAVDYKADRDAEAMKGWIQSFFETKIIPLTETEVKGKIGSQDFFLIQGASAQQLKVLEVANFVDRSVEYYSIGEGEYKLTLYLKKDSTTVDYTGKLDVDELTAWTIENSSPPLVFLDSEVQTKSIFQNKDKIPAFLLFKANDFSQQAFNTLSAICEQSKPSFKCSYVDSTAVLYQGVARYLKVTDFNQSLLAFVQYGLKVAYKFPNPSQLTKESIDQFLEDVKQGKIEKHLDHEKQDKEQKIDYVNVLSLNAQTYNQTLANNKYVFIQYYSPNCGHCIKFAPEYEKLATKVKEEGLQYVIAAVDLANEKEVSGWVDVQGYPTLRFYINGKSINYNGKRSAQDILNFIGEAIKVKLQSVESIQSISKPSVVVFGVGEDSELQYLPLSFTKHPIYSMKGEQLRVEFHSSKGVKVYSGQQDLSSVADWLEVTSQPLVGGIVDKQPTKRLKIALAGKYPILVVVKRDENAGHVLSVMEEYCEGKDELACGYAGKGDDDYEQFSKWLEDNKPDQSLLVYINTNNFNKAIYEGDLAKLTPSDIHSFLEKAKATQAQAKAEANVEQTEASVQAPQETEPVAAEGGEQL